MIERRGRDFDLARGRELAVFGNHARADVALLAPHQRLIFEREVSALFDQGAHIRIVLLELLVEPGELGENLQIAEVLRRESWHSGLVRGEESPYRG